MERITILEEGGMKSEVICFLIYLVSTEELHLMQAG